MATGKKPHTVGGDIDYTRFLDCVHCGLCTSACPTYLETGDENDSPRGRIYLMRGVVDGRIELSETVRGHLELCLDCRNCETACPSGVQYGRLIEPFRVEMESGGGDEATGHKPGWFERYILHGLFPYAGRMRWALVPARWMQLLKLDRLAEKLGLVHLLPERLQRMHRLLPKLGPRPPRLPEVLPPKGPKRARVALFTGCVAEGMFAETNRATARVLQENGCEVVVPRDQVCCGAIHYHSGAAGQAMDFARTNASVFNAADVDAVILNVAGCGAMMKDYAHIAEENHVADSALAQLAGKVTDVCQFLADLGPVPPKGEIPLRATYHDACHLVHAQQVRSAPRELLAMIPGLELVPLAESDLCCGAAGSYNLVQPEMADRLAARKTRNIRATEARCVVAGNAGCSLQIQAALRENGDDVWVAHPVDLLDLSYRGLKPPISTATPQTETSPTGA